MHVSPQCSHILAYCGSLSGWLIISTPDSSETIRCNHRLQLSHKALDDAAAHGLQQTGRIEVTCCSALLYGCARMETTLLLGVAPPLQAYEIGDTACCKCGLNKASKGEDGHYAQSSYRVPRHRERLRITSI